MTKNSSLLALSRVHSHQRLKPFPLLHLFCCGGFPRPVSALQPVLSNMLNPICFQHCLLCLFPTCLFSLHLLLMRLAASLHSAHILSPFAQFSHPSLLMSAEFCPRFTSTSCSLHCIFCCCCCFFSSRLFLCPWVQITSLIRGLFSTRNPESSRAKPWETDVSSTRRRDKQKSAPKHKIYLKIHKLYCQTWENALKSTNARYKKSKILKYWTIKSYIAKILVFSALILHQSSYACSYKHTKYK